ncbi:MAG: cytochrome c maturation protein CcmE [Oleibacter sp.]|nr:cytochrome c maturation protein CcmE [Thalassolituus sp.]
MHPVRKQRLKIVLLLVAAVAIAVGLATYSLSSNINLFYTPTQIASGEAPQGRTIRAGGLVMNGSVVRFDNGLGATFVVTDNQAQVSISYDGILPDLFREGQGIVAMGQLNADGQFIASEVLAKHDEEYMPPEVKEALEKADKEGRKAMMEAASYE